jgi:hypothetical protein
VAGFAPGRVPEPCEACGGTCLEPSACHARDGPVLSPRLPPAWTRPRPLSGRCVTVVGPVVDGDLQCCSMKEEHARRLCFSANEPLNNADIPSLVSSHRREGRDRHARGDRPGRAVCAHGPFTEAPLPYGRHSLESSPSHGRPRLLPGDRADSVSSAFRVPGQLRGVPYQR